MDANIKSSFWRDKLLVNGEVRTAFLWLWTNSDRTVCGVTPLCERKFEFDTGLQKDALEKCIELLAGRVIVVGDYVWVKNFIRHQFGTGEKLKRNSIIKRLKNEVSQHPKELQTTILQNYPELSDGGATPPPGGLDVSTPPLNPNSIPPCGGGATGVPPPQAEPSRAEQSREKGGLGEIEAEIPTVNEMANALASAGVRMTTIQKYHDWHTSRQTWVIRNGLGHVVLRNWKVDVMGWERKEREMPPPGKGTAGHANLKAEMANLTRRLFRLDPVKDAVELEKINARRKELRDQGIFHEE